VSVAKPTPSTASGPLLRDLTRRRDQILALAARHGAENVRVFGSVARGEAVAESDVDFLVDLEQGRSLFDLAGLLVDLEDLIGRPVDVVTVSGLKARIRASVLDEAVPI
jgi:predicted nucleotidyltransferase